MEKIKAKSCLFVKINKTNKVLAKVNKKKRKNTNYLIISNDSVSV